MSQLQAVMETLRQYSLSLPETVEEHPWEETVTKVNGKVFVFFGVADATGKARFMAVKLPKSLDDVLNLPFARPMGYGLGKHGWVDFVFAPNDDAPVELMKDWILESYRAIAPKKLVAQLDSQQ